MRTLFAFLMSLLLLGIGSIMPVVAQDLSCGDITPARYSFDVVDDEGIQGGGSSSDTATFKFRLSRNQIKALQCAGSSLEIDFRFTNYEYREGETEVKFDDNGLGSYQYIAYDAFGDPIMRAAGIDPSNLVANKTYTISVTFRMFYAYNMDNGEPHTLSLEWAPGEWYPESYLGECADDLVDEVTVAKSTYCSFRYDDEAVELGVHDFGY